MTVFGFAAGVHDEWCAAHPRNRRLMWCGRPRGFVPVEQPPFVPAELHAVCRELMTRRRYRNAEAPVVDGVCPVCGGDDVPVRAGVVQAHCKRVVGRSGLRMVCTDPCAGAGEAPEVG